MGSPTEITPISGVIFDFHSTLVSGGDTAGWIDAAWQSLGRLGDPTSELGAGTVAAAVVFLDRIWEHAGDIDPDSGRDLSPERHRGVFDATIERAPGVDVELAKALYVAMPDRLVAYADSAPVLRALRDRGTRIAILSNVGFDLRPFIARSALAGLADALVMSFEVGAVKPNPAIFQRALDLLGVPPEEALMVGDSWRDDGAAAALGVRTLILPRTDGPVHGLEVVLRLVGG